MKTRIIKIGNSHGIRIPKAILQQTGLGDEIDLTVEDSQIILRRAHRPREGWEQRFAEMAAHGDDALLDGDQTAQSEWDDTEWEW